MPNTAAIYARVSTPGQEQDGLGLEAQLDSCRRTAADYGLTVDNAFIVSEQGSGAFLERHGLDRVRQYVRAGAIDALIVYDVDRLSRDELGTLILLDEASKAGVTIYTRTGPVDATGEGNLISHVRAYAARIERDKIRNRTMDGKRSAVRIRNVLPSGAGAGLYGYDYRPRSQEASQARSINEDEAEVVRRMFAMYAAGTGPHAIAATLNREGIPAKKGGTWAPLTVRNILLNENYVGVTTYGAESTKMVAHNKRRRSPGDPGSILRFEGFTPPIIDRGTWEIVQTKLKQGRRLVAETPYLLSGMVRCECGCGMTGQSINRGRWRYYRCRNNVGRAGMPRTCDSRAVNVDTLEPRIRAALRRQLASPATLRELVANTVTTAERPTPVVDNEATVNALQALALEEAQISASMREAATAMDTDGMLRLGESLKKLKARQAKLARTQKAPEGPLNTQVDGDIDSIDYEGLADAVKAGLRSLDNAGLHKLLALLNLQVLVLKDGTVTAEVTLPVGMKEAPGDDSPGAKGSESEGQRASGELGPLYEHRHVHNLAQTNTPITVNLPLPELAECA